MIARRRATAVLGAVFGLGVSGAVADTPSPTFPALYRIVDVAPDDVLNARESPDASSYAIGVFVPTAPAIEVLELSREGGWARVNYDETIAWVSMRYLQRMPVDTDTLGLPKSLSCFGVEPFWQAKFTGSALVIDSATLNGPFTLVDMAPDPGVMDVAANGALFRWSFEGQIVEGRILPGRCSDTMSDTLYGLHYVDPVLGHGCCTLG